MLESITEAVKQKFFQPAKSAPLPSSMDLATHFQKFVKYWADADLQYLGPIREDVSNMPVEVSVKWKGTIGGRIVIRCRPEILKWLRESRDYKPLNLCTENEIFNEMSSLYAVYLIYSFWMSDFSEMGLILPRPSTAADWPHKEPDATCALSVQNNLVEIRLWVGATGA
jgi:hypothetical protein